MPLKVKTSASGTGVWKTVEQFLLKTSNAGSGVWKNIKGAYIKTDAGWKMFFGTPGPLIEIETQVSIALSGGTNASHNIMDDSSAVTITATKYHWSGADTYTYVWQKSPDNINWSNIGSPTSTTNPASGSSSSIIKTLSSSDFTSGSDMYFRFVFIAVNSTYSTTNSSTSSSALVSYYGTPTPISPYPNITGSTTVGYVAYGNIGTWTNSPTQYDYQWSYLNGTTVYPLTDTQSKSISTKTLSGYSASITTSTSHGYRVGDYLSVSGMDNLFDGSQLITSVSSNSISFTLPTQTNYSLTTAYTANTSFVNYFSNAYKALQSMPTPSTYVSTNSYASGSFVQNGLARYVAIQFVPANTSITNTLYWQNIAPTNSSYWQLQSFSGASTSGSTLGYIYFDGTVYSSTSIPLTTLQTDAKTLTDLRGKVLYFIVKAYNPATLSPSGYTGARFIYGYPVITVGSITTSDTSASIPYTQSYMTEYDIDVKYLGTSISGYPKTITSPSSPISITGLVAPRTYTYAISPKNGEGTFGLDATGSFDTIVAAPVNTVAPLISPTSGTAGTTQYSVTNGTWTGSPTGYSYQWKYQDQVNVWLNAPGTSNAATYTPPITFFTAGYSSPIKCTVTAINLGGSTPQDSSNTASISPASKSVTYKANGGTGTDVVISYNYGATVTVASNTFTRSNATFSSWNTASNGTGTSYSPGNTFTITSDTILYAQWTLLPSPPTITSSSSTTSSITLNFTQGANSTSTRAYIGGVFDGSTTSTSYTYLGLQPGTSYTLALYGYNGSVLSSTSSGGSYSTTTGAALTPTFGTNSSTTGGFFGSVTNYDANYTWGISASVGTVTWSSPSGSTRAFTVSGLSAGQSSTVTVTTSRTGYNNGSNNTIGTASNPSYTITFSPSGYVVGSSNTFVTSPTANTIRTGTVGQLASAPADPTPPSGYTFAGYWRDGSPLNYVNQVNSGGSWTITATDKTFYGYYNAIIPNISSITVTGNVTAGVTCTAVMTNTFSVEYVIYGRDTTTSAWVQLAAGTASANGTSLTTSIGTTSSVGTLPDQYYVTMKPYYGARSTSGAGGGTGTAGTQRSTISSPKSNASGSITVNY